MTAPTMPDLRDCMLLITAEATPTKLVIIFRGLTTTTCERIHARLWGTSPDKPVRLPETIVNLSYLFNRQAASTLEGLIWIAELDGYGNHVTLRVVDGADPYAAQSAVRAFLEELGISVE